MPLRDNSRLADHLEIIARGDWQLFLR